VSQAQAAWREELDARLVAVFERVSAALALQLPPGKDDHQSSAAKVAAAGDATGDAKAETKRAVADEKTAAAAEAAGGERKQDSAAKATAKSQPALQAAPAGWSVDAAALSASERQEMESLARMLSIRGLRSLIGDYCVR
jgi:hypothetical protein